MAGTPYATTDPVEGFVKDVLGTEITKGTDTEQKVTGGGTSTTNTAGGSTTSSNTNGVSTADNTGTQKSTGGSSGTGTTSTDGTTTGTTTGSNSSDSVANSTQKVTGTTNTSGTTNTTGTTKNITDTTSTHQNVNQTSADIAALQEILQRQMAGISPEMLKSIFEQGSKEAPQLLSTQANALGARTGSNTPLAAALNMLNSNMTSKAADINFQMLHDAMTSASKIGDLTKRVTDSGTDTTHTVSTQTQDVQTINSQTQVVNQLIEGLTNTHTTGTNTGTTAGTTSSKGTTTHDDTNFNNTDTASHGVNANNTTTAGATNSTNISNTATDTHQNTVAHEEVNTKQTINTDIAKSLAGAAAAGLGIDALFKLATGKGFVGTVQDFINSMRGVVTDSTISRWMSEGTFSSTPGGTDGFEFGGSTDGLMGPDQGLMGPDAGIVGPTLDDMPVDVDWGFADGGNPSEEMLSMDNLGVYTPVIKKTPQGVKDPTDGSSIASILNGTSPFAALASALLGGSNAHSLNSSGSPAPSGVLAKADTIDPSKAVSGKQTINLGGDGGGGTDTINSSNMGDVVEQRGTRQVGGESGYTEDTGVVGYNRGVGRSGNATLQDNYDASGNFISRELQKPDPIMTLIETAVPMIASYAMPGVGAVMGAGRVDQAGQTGDIGGILSGLLGMFTGSKSIGGGAIPPKLGTPPIGKADGGVIQNPSATADAAEPVSEEGPGDPDEAHDRMLQVLGITRLPDGYQVTKQGLQTIHRAMSGSSTAPGYSNGGRIVGPGTGISDSIPAQGPGGQPLKVSNGETIIPADVVEKLGQDFFDHLINKYHTPADMQRAMGLE